MRIVQTAGLSWMDSGLVVVAIIQHCFGYARIQHRLTITNTVEMNCTQYCTMYVHCLVILAPDRQMTCQSSHSPKTGY